MTLKIIKTVLLIVALILALNLFGIIWHFGDEWAKSIAENGGLIMTSIKATVRALLCIVSIGASIALGWMTAKTIEHVWS